MKVVNLVPTKTAFALRTRTCPRICWAIVAALVAATSTEAQEYVRNSQPNLLSYDELVQLSLTEKLSPELEKKLHAVTTTPFINNEAYFRGARSRPLNMDGLGPTLRIAF